MNSFFLSLGGTGMDLVGDLEVIFFSPFFFSFLGTHVGFLR